MELTDLSDHLRNAFAEYLGGILGLLPRLAAGLVVLGLGWLVARAVRWIVRGAAQRAIDPVMARSGADAVLARFGGLRWSAFLAAAAHAVAWLLFITAAARVMGIGLVDEALRAVLAYLPTAATALAILLFGLWLADKASAGFQRLAEAIGLGGGRLLAKAIAGGIILLMAITALNVAGIDTSLITANVQIVLAGVLLAFGLAYGLAARDVLTNTLGSFYGKDRFKPGMRVRIGQDEGVIERIDAISITLRTADRLVMLPTARLVSERIEVLGEPVEEA